MAELLADCRSARCSPSAPSARRAAPASRCAAPRAACDARRGRDRAAAGRGAEAAFAVELADAPRAAPAAASSSSAPGRAAGWRCRSPPTCSPGSSAPSAPRLACSSRAAGWSSCEATGADAAAGAGEAGPARSRSRRVSGRRGGDDHGRACQPHPMARGRAAVLALRRRPFLSRRLPARRSPPPPPNSDSIGEADARPSGRPGKRRKRLPLIRNRPRKGRPAALAPPQRVPVGWGQRPEPTGRREASLGGGGRLA